MDFPLIVTKEMRKQRKFVCYLYANGAFNISFGVSLDVRYPNLEVHLPFGFLRIGWEGKFVDCWDSSHTATYGFDQGWKWGESSKPSFFLIED